jgi:hypothetical protein
MMQKHKTTTPISETRVYKARDDAQREREREKKQRKETKQKSAHFTSSESHSFAGTHAANKH